MPLHLSHTSGCSARTSNNIKNLSSVIAGLRYIQQPMSASIPATGLSIVPVAPAVTAASSVTSAVSDAFPPSWSLMGSRRVVDQGNVRCCVSCAIAAATESANGDWAALSPLFHYFVTRTPVMGGSPLQNVDLTLEDANSAVETIGISLNSLHDKTMDLAGMAAAPSQAARSDALSRRLPPISILPPASRIVLLGDQNREQEWKMALLTGKPIIAGIDLPAGYSKAMTRATTADGRLGPSHAVAILGYRDREQAFIVQDSRGPDWFLGGQWWMPYSFAESSFVFKAYSLNFK